MTTATTVVPTPEQEASVYAEYQREQDRLASLRYAVTLHYDEHPSIDSRVVWEGAGFWVAARWARSAAKSLICTTAHAYVEHNAENSVYSAFRRDWRPGQSGYILVGHVSVAEVPLSREPVTCPTCFGSGDGPVLTSGLDNQGVPWAITDKCPTCQGHHRVFTPEQQIANVRAALAGLRLSKRHQGRKAAITAAEHQLAEMEARHARGELAPIPDDGVPF